eukprot:g48634.t1
MSMINSRGNLVICIVIVIAAGDFDLAITSNIVIISGVIIFIAIDIANSSGAPTGRTTVRSGLWSIGIGPCTTFAATASGCFGRFSAVPGFTCTSSRSRTTRSNSGKQERSPYTPASPSSLPSKIGTPPRSTQRATRRIQGLSKEAEQALQSACQPQQLPSGSHPRRINLWHHQGFITSYAHGNSNAATATIHGNAYPKAKIGIWKKVSLLVNEGRRTGNDIPQPQPDFENGAREHNFPDGVFAFQASTRRGQHARL